MKKLELLEVWHFAKSHRDLDAKPGLADSKVWCSWPLGQMYDLGRVTSVSFTSVKERAKPG